MSSDRPDAGTTRSYDSSDASSAPDAESSSLPTGTRIGNYTIRRPIGRGGMGATVYEAIQESPQRLVALKYLPREAGGDALERFEREAEALALVRHQHVVSVIESGVAANGAAFMAMELIVGAKTLDDYANSRRPIASMRQRVALMIDVCGAIAEIHRLGLVHRDLKPSNILVDAGGVAKLVDFGITTAVNSEVFGASLPAFAAPSHGTPGYMSPEQLRGSSGTIDARSDVYALGVILFEMLTGQPFRVVGSVASDTTASPTEALAASSTKPSELSPALNHDVDRIVRRALSPEPSDRFASAGEFGQALQNLLDDVAPPGLTDSAVGGAARRCRRLCRQFPRLAAMLAVAAGAGIGLFVLEPQVFAALRFGICEPALVRAATPKPSLNVMSNVTMVTLDDAFDPARVSEAMKYQGIESDPESRESMRRLDARLIDRLVECDVKAIAIDLSFTVPTDGDSELAAAAIRAAKGGVPVVSIADDWNEESGIIPSLRDAFRLGGAEAEVGPGAWSLHLAHEVRPGDVVPSLALISWLAAHAPKSRWEVSIDLPATVTAHAFNPANGVDAQGRARETPGETISIAASSIVEPPGPNGIVTPATPTSARLRVNMPDDDVLAHSTVRYADVVGPQANPAALRASLRGRIALVGDLRATGEPRQKYVDGRLLPAFYANAAAIESLGSSIQGDSIALDFLALPLAILASSCLGVGVARMTVIHRPSNVIGRIISAALALAVVAFFVTSVAFIAASQEKWILNPGPLFVAGAAGFFIFRAVRRNSRLPLT